MARESNASAGSAPQRSRPAGGKTKASAPAPAQSPNPFASSQESDEFSDDEAPRPKARSRGAEGTGDDAYAETEKEIPRDLMTRLLHEFFAKEATRMSKDANAAVGKYVDVFVREAIARTAQEKQGGFLEVEDLEKISPQLLLDL